MAGREGPDDGSSRARAVAAGGFARGLGLVLGPVLACVVLPWAACRTVCVPLRTLCEDAGGEFHSSFALGVPIDASHPCPPGFDADPNIDGCSTISLSGLVCVPPAPFR